MDLRNAIRALQRQGKGIKYIARELGLARNTVRKYLRGEYPPKTTRRRKPNPDLVPFLDDIRDMLASNLIGSRILRELRKQGYQGPERTFYRLLHKLQERYAENPAVERFETPPGRQGQFDWAVYAAAIGSEVTKVYVFDFILGYSRYQHFYASLTVNQKAVFEALEDAFHHLRGVPKEVLIDNPRTMVLQPKPKLIWNPHFQDFAAHYGFTPIACWPYRAQTKGKVENPNRFLEEQFIKGSTFHGFADFVRRLTDFETNVVNVHLHGTTQERPLDRLTKEQHLLIGLPEIRFIATRELFRKVSHDCLISFGGSRYSVPWQYAGKLVWIRYTQQRRLEIYAQNGALLTSHDLNPRKGSVNTRQEHYAGLRDAPQGYKTLMIDIFQARFPDDRQFLTQLLAQYKFNATQQLRRILHLEKSYGKATLQAAFQVARECNTYSANFIQGVLQQQAEGVEALALIRSDRPIPKVAVQCELDVYQRLAEQGSDHE